MKTIAAGKEARLKGFIQTEPAELPNRNLRPFPVLGGALDLSLQPRRINILSNSFFVFFFYLWEVLAVQHGSKISTLSQSRRKQTFLSVN